MCTKVYLHITLSRAGGDACRAPLVILVAMQT